MPETAAPDHSLFVSVLALVGKFDAAEDSLRYEGLQIAPLELFDEAVSEAIARLMATRLGGNPDMAPLTPSDANGITTEIMKGLGDFSSGVDLEALLHRNAATNVGARLVELAAIDADQRNALWERVSAIFSVASARGLTPHEVVDSPEARAEAIALYMPRASWDRYTDGIVRVLTQYNPSGDAQGPVTPEDPIVPAPAGSRREEIVAAIRHCMAQRGREIWPSTR